MTDSMMTHYGVEFEHKVIVPGSSFAKTSWCCVHVGEEGVDWQWCYSDYSYSLLEFGFRNAAAATMFALRWL